MESVLREQRKTLRHPFTDDSNRLRLRLRCRLAGSVFVGSGWVQAKIPRVCPTHRNVTSESPEAIVRRLFSLPGVQAVSVRCLPSRPFAGRGNGVHASGCPSDGRQATVTSRGFQPVRFPVVICRGGSKRASASPRRALGSSPGALISSGRRLSRMEES